MACHCRMALFAHWIAAWQRSRDSPAQSLNYELVGLGFRFVEKFHLRDLLNGAECILLTNHLCGNAAG